MASPQKEKGYTQIANEILEKLTRVNLKGSEFAVVLAIIRKTYGFHKKMDKISISQLEEMIGISRRAVIYNLQNLEAKKIIIVKRGRKGDKNEVNIISFNKDYDLWVVQNSAPQIEENRRRAKERSAKLRSGAKLSDLVVQNSAESLPSFAPTKETLTKDNTKDNNTAEPSSAGYNPLGAEIIKAFEGVDPKNKTYYGNTTQRKACDFLIEEYGLEKVLERISVLGRTNKLPYFPNISTPVQLWDKWVALEDAVARKRGELSKKKKIYV